MKIGIVNFHFAHNYGAMLQAYALQESLREMGNESIIIDFKPNEIMDGYEIWTFKKIRNIKSFLWTIKNYRRLKLKYDVFEEFKNKYMNLTNETYKTIESSTLNKYNFDVFVCGSDQIWNMDLNCGLKEYLLSFSNDSKVKKISYAASIGSNKIKKEHVKIMKNDLKSFDSISVREDDAVKIINKEFNLKAVQVLDPVFLLSKEQWEKISLDVDLKGEKYILLYGLEENELFENIFSVLKEETNFKIVNISPNKSKSKYVDENLFNVGPREFIGLLSKAEIVVTNSFHGTCFSIIFGKRFFTIGHSELNSRMESILRLMNLENHMIREKVKSIDELNYIINDNLDNIEEILKSEIYKSKMFLKDAIK
ncbi:polysaccharide pyruvyl transferase family protein [Clostridium sp. C8]|uniref:polysaccharide pyruvyl transferase family protein n=1 Tax=Clostridium sp. C8 TaxID=1667357 RepID=UPI00062E515F|nr:polysaccharide pyruvyl transferase family protein [Clostridium sp. C8]KLE14595.1 hypothetical protein AAT22_15805 [Clostridium sp. C8]